MGDVSIGKGVPLSGFDPEIELGAGSPLENAPEPSAPPPTAQQQAAQQQAAPPGSGSFVPLGGLSGDLLAGLIAQGEPLSRAPAGPDPVRVGEGARRLYEAMRGLGTDEDAIFSVLENRPAAEVAAIEQRFAERFGGEFGSLRDALYSELSGRDLQRALGALDRAAVLAQLGPEPAQGGADPLHIEGARALQDAMRGIGTNENALFTLLENAPPADVVGMERAFDKLFGAEWGGSLRSALYEELSGDDLTRALGALDRAEMTARAQAREQRMQAASAARGASSPQSVPTPGTKGAASPSIELPDPGAATPLQGGYGQLDPVRQGQFELLRGMQGPDVMALQMALQMAGYPVETTGTFDTRTEAAMMLFQMDAGQPASGVCGRAGALALDRRFGVPGRPGALGAPAAVDPMRVAQGVEQLHRAMAGLGTDEAAIYDVLENRPPAEVVAIAQQFAQRYGMQWGSLGQALVSEMSGLELNRALGALNRAFAMTFGGPGAVAAPTPNARFAFAQSAAYALHRAMAGLGTDEQTVYRILGSLSPSDMVLVEGAFRRNFGWQWGSLRQALVSEFSGFELMRALQLHDGKLAAAYRGWR